MTCPRCTNLEVEIHSLREQVQGINTHRNILREELAKERQKNADLLDKLNLAKSILEGEYPPCSK